ncbi:MAG: hypothetical protein IPJ30_03915 [Acidobacteria bacterium]|nr:hypothetical protein [Acidobacteriota bacterium]
MRFAMKRIAPSGAAPGPCQITPDTITTRRRRGYDRVGTVAQPSRDPLTDRR